MSFPDRCLARTCLAASGIRLGSSAATMFGGLAWMLLRPRIEPLTGPYLSSRGPGFHPSPPTTGPLIYS